MCVEPADCCNYHTMDEYNVQYASILQDNDFKSIYAYISSVIYICIYLVWKSFISTMYVQCAILGINKCFHPPICVYIFNLCIKKVDMQEI